MSYKLNNWDISNITYLTPQPGVAPEAGRAYFTFDVPDLSVTPYSNLTNSTEITDTFTGNSVEVVALFDDHGTDSYFKLYIDDGTNRAGIKIYNGSIVTLDNTHTLVVENTDNQLHRYTLTLQNGILNVLFDTVNILTYVVSENSVTSQFGLGFFESYIGAATLNVKYLKQAKGVYQYVKLPEVDFELQIDSSNTFDSVNLHTYTKASFATVPASPKAWDPVSFICGNYTEAGYDFNGLVQAATVQLPVRQYDKEHEFYYRVRFKGDVYNSGWSETYLTRRYKPIVLPEESSEESGGEESGGGGDVPEGGIDENTILMLHLDGNYADSSFYAADNVLYQQPTGDFSFVDSFDGETHFNQFLKGTGPTASDMITYIRNDSVFPSINGDLTVDLWALYPSTATSASTFHQVVFYSKTLQQDNLLQIIICPWRKSVDFLIEYSWVTVNFSESFTKDLLDNKYHHYAIQYRAADTTFSIYVDGELVANTSSYDYTAFFTELYDIRFNPTIHSSSVSTCFDEIRFSNIARYDSNFIPPTRPYSEVIALNVEEESNIEEPIDYEDTYVNQDPYNIAYEILADDNKYIAFKPTQAGLGIQLPETPTTDGLTFTIHNASDFDLNVFTFDKFLPFIIKAQNVVNVTYDLATDKWYNSIVAGQKKFVLPQNIQKIVFDVVYKSHIPAYDYVYTKQFSSGNVADFVRTFASGIDYTINQFGIDKTNLDAFSADRDSFNQRFSNIFNFDVSLFKNSAEMRDTMLCLNNSLPGQMLEGPIKELIYELTGATPRIYEYKDVNFNVLWSEAERKKLPSSEKFYLYDEQHPSFFQKPFVLYGGSAKAFTWQIDVFDPYNLKYNQDLIKQVIDMYKPAHTYVIINFYNYEGVEYTKRYYYGTDNYIESLYNL